MSIVIDRLVLREIRLPLKQEFRISSGRTAVRRILLLELSDRDGVAAWSECTAAESPNYSPETIDTAWLAIREWIAPLVLGHEFGEPSEVHSVLERRIRGHNMAKAAIEMGTWALAAQRSDTSLARLLGGTRSEIATGISLGIQPDPEALVERARAAVAAGYQRIKCKIAPGADVEHIAAVRAALGTDVPLSVDANGAYALDDADQLSRLDAFELVMIEQPLAAGDLLRHAELQKRLRTPICLDESITGPQAAEDMLKLGSAKIVNIKAGRVGGLAAALAIHDICAAHNVPVWCGGMLESGIGRAYNVALAALANFTLPGDVSPSQRYWERDIVTPEWVMSVAGLVEVPLERPGIGVTVQVDRVEDSTIRAETLVAA